MREVPTSTTKVKTRKPTTSFGVLFFAAILAVGIPSALSAEEITPSRPLYNYGGGDNVTTWLGIAASWNGRVFKNTDGSDEVAARDSAGPNASRPQAAIATRFPCRHRGTSLRSHASNAVLSMRLSEVQPRMPLNGWPWTRETELALATASAGRSICRSDFAAECEVQGPGNISASLSLAHAAP